MAFATAEDVATRLGRTLTGTEAATATQLLTAATAVIAGAADKDDAWADALSPVPKILGQLTIELVYRVMSNPENLATSQEQIGAYQYRKGFQTGAASGLLLTDTEERLVRRVVHGRTTASVRLESVASERPGGSARA